MRRADVIAAISADRPEPSRGRSAGIIHRDDRHQALQVKLGLTANRVVEVAK